MPDLLLYFQKIMADLKLTYKMGFPERLHSFAQVHPTRPRFNQKSEAREFLPNFNKYSPTVAFIEATHLPFQRRAAGSAFHPSLIHLADFLIL
jgi:hypothetical protein